MFFLPSWPAQRETSLQLGEITEVAVTESEVNLYWTSKEPHLYYVSKPKFEYSKICNKFPSEIPQELVS